VVEIRKLMDVEDFGDGFTPNPEIAKVKFTQKRAPRVLARSVVS
jgi:hypothetical protein